MPCHALICRIALLAVATLMTAGVALSQDYPSKPIRLIVPFPPGGPTDIVGRIAGHGIEEKAGKPVIIENRPGAGGLVGLDAAARASALQAEKGRLRFFTDTSWNVKARQE